MTTHERPILKPEAVIATGQRRRSKAPEMENERTREIVVGEPLSEARVYWTVSFADGSPWCDMSARAILDRYPEVLS